MAISRNRFGPTDSYQETTYDVASTGVECNLQGVPQYFPAFITLPAVKSHVRSSGNEGCDRKKAEVAALCNNEVLSLLNELKEDGQVQKIGNHLATILYETSQYLDGVCGEYNCEQVKELVKALLDFPVALTHNEKLMIVNTPPTTPLQLSLILHNCDERLTEEHTEQLLSIINNSLPL
ncbi:hypothetical protein AAG570_005863 [Ranatra chinensis]|uniref:DNA-directed RNA polymerase III subunit RPC9 n=1 Tax=Ranatra chinensis TaxID=642074 RepID=A0ABD0YBF7_9HEMI